MKTLAIAALGFLATPFAQAATIHADGVVCSLTDAIAAANTDTATGGCPQGDLGTDTIVLDADVTLSAVDGASTVHGGVGAGLPDVTDDLSIVAGLGSAIRRDPAFTCDASTGDPVFRFLNLEAGALVLDGLSFENGCFVAADATNEGGGIRAAAATELTLDGVSILAFDAISTSGAIDGGFLFTEGNRLTVVDSIFEDVFITAATSLDGGAVYIDDLVTNAMIQDTSFLDLETSSGSSSLRGGAVYARADLTLEDTDFADFVVASGSGLQGGALYFASASSVLVRRATFARFVVSSVSSLQGGGLYASNDVFRLVDVVFSGLESTSNNTCTGGSLYANQDGPYERLLIEDLSCRSLTSGVEGAAARLLGSAPVIEDCIFRHNEARAHGTARGGAVFAADFERLERCAFVDNLAISEGSSSSRDARGGGLQAGRVGLLRNVTFSGNVAQAADGIDLGVNGGSAEGGGLILTSGSESSILSAVTFTNNKAIAGVGANGFLEGVALGGGVFVNLDHTAEIVGSILSGNTVIDAFGNPSAEDCVAEGSLVSQGYNVVQDPDSSCDFSAFGDVTGLDPQLYPIDDYGCARTLLEGSCVPTAAIDQTSWAIDWGSCADAGVAVDARGLERREDVVGVLNLAADACDAGAFEARDSDGDGITDVPDLCPNDADADQRDSDDDGVGDACDACSGDDASGDGDGDLVCDDTDVCAGFDDRADADLDTVPDGCDLCLGDDLAGDGDGDLVCDDLDRCAGFDDALDADGDGVPDGCDRCAGDDKSGDGDDDGLCDDRDASVGDRVWLDDGNGIQDGGEPGVAGVTVHLFSAAGLLVDTTSTDPDGRFEFSPGPGEHYLEFVPPADMAFALRDQGADDSADSDPSTSTGTTSIFILVAGQAEPGLDAGLEPAVIGDRVWLDANADGRQQPGEAGLAGVNVRLLDPADAEVAVTSTGADGAFGFAGVASGDYRIEVVLPIDAVFTSQDVGADELIDSDVDPATGRGPLFSYQEGTASRRWDAGLLLLPLPFFADGFESGEVSAWSLALP